MNVALLSISLLALSLALHALMMGYETGFLAADRAKIMRLAHADKGGRASLLHRLMLAPERTAAVLILTANSALVIAALALHSLVRNEWLTIVIAAPVFVVLGAIVPRALFRRQPNRLSLSFLPIIRLFDAVLAPVVLPTAWVLRKLGWQTHTEQSAAPSMLASQDDLRNLVDQSAARGTIEKEEQEMIHSIMDLANIQANEIMVPRIDVQAVPISTTRSALVEAFRSTGRTRIPVYSDTIDNIIGIVIAHDVLIDDQPGDQTIQRFIKPVRHVPDTKPAGELLQELKAQRQHMAVVINEYGSTDGIITMEDILEEIFGEIQDEHDPEPRHIIEVAENAYVVDARTAVDEFAARLNLDLGEHEAETVAGWVMHVAQRIPKQGECIHFENLQITILEGANNQIHKVRIDVTTPRGEDAA